MKGQALQITDDFLSVSEWTRPGVLRKETRGIVVHFTGWLGVPCRAKNTRDYFESIPPAVFRVATQAQADWTKGITDACGTLQQMTLKRMWAKGLYGASSNFVVGLPEEIREGRGILRLMRDEEKSYTSGWFSYSKLVHEKYGSNPNEYTIGIEVAAIDGPPEGDGRFAPETYEKLIDLLVYLCRKFSLSSTDIDRHYDMCDPNIGTPPKACPLWFVKHPEDWAKLREDVRVRVGQ